MHVYFDGLAGPVEFVDAEPVLAGLGGLLRGWRCEVASPEAPPARSLVSVRRCGPEYVISVPWHEEAYGETTVVGALCTLIVDLVEAYVRSGAGRMCLHCAAAEIDGRLVVFPAASRAGKSTLAAALAAAGQRVFTDDLLAIDPAAERGMALGVPPRLRLPLPEGLDAAFVDFLKRHAGLSDSHYRYLDLPEGLQAAFGTTAPLGAVVLLERLEGRAEARLDPVDAGSAMRLLLGQSLSADGASSELLEAFHGLIGRLPCLALRYGALDDAVELLLQEVPGLTEAAMAAPSPIELRSRRAGDLEEEPGGRLFQQVPAVYAQAVDDRLFLTNETGRSICELDLIGAGIWNLLAEPVSAAEAIEVLVELFPDADPMQISDDVGRLLQDLERQGLIQQYELRS